MNILKAGTEAPDATVEAIENVMAELRPPTLDEYGFLPALLMPDDQHVAEGLRYLVQAQLDMEVIACAGDGREAVNQSLAANADVILMDNDMPVLNGTDATRIICAHRPQTHIVILSMYSDPIHVCRALEAGVSGYVVKKSLGKELVDAIRAVHDGRRYLSRPLVDSMIDQLISKSKDPLERFSPRERQVLQLLAEGRSMADVAITLSLSPEAVETYRVRMIGKLDIRDLASLVKFAIRHGVAALE